MNMQPAPRATFRIAYLVIGRLRRRELRSTLGVARALGCTVGYHERWGLLESTITNLSVEGPEDIVRECAWQVTSRLDNFS